MASPNTLDTKLFSKLGQPTIQAATAFATELHEVLDIVQHREEGFSEFQERFQGLRHVLPGEHPEQVAEVMPTVKSDPLDIVVEHDARRHHQHGEAGGVGALGRETLEVDSTAAEQVDGVTVARVAERVEATEVELPDAGPAPRAARRELAFLVGEDEAELDELEHVDVALEDGVVALILVAEWAHRLQYDAGELRVHGNAGYLSTTSRITLNSSSRFAAQTSRISTSVGVSVAGGGTAIGAADTSKSSRRLRAEGQRDDKAVPAAARVRVCGAVCWGRAARVDGCNKKRRVRRRRRTVSSSVMDGENP
jgi:hypothetical protein